ncbi:MAG TPA: FAD-binding and (Fe-S)-binding domain-containing protein [Roseiflexaceae bacterium]|nr:FAD-binding and (Fe-S)-binding domain-containing protein [Roseiflexaceae bacterium]
MTAHEDQIEARNHHKRATPTIPLTNVGYESGNLLSYDVDAEGLAAELRATIKGEVRFDDGSRALYSTDSSNYRQIPIGVVMPRDKDDVIATVAACRRYGAPVLSRGGGTSLAGQCCNVAVVMDMSKYMHGVLEVDPAKKQARVLPGTVLDDLRAATEPHGLTFGPDPATHNHCTLGGMIGNDSCGVHSVMAARYGDGARTADNIEELEILTYDGMRMRVGKTSEEELERIIREGGRKGEIYRKLRTLRNVYADEIRTRYPDIPRRVSGYNLAYLLPEHGFNVARALVGSEGTCVTILEATANLIHNPPARSLLVLGYPDAYTAADHVPEIMKHEPVGLEGFDDKLVRAMQEEDLRTKDVALLPPGGGWLLVEFGGDSKQESDDKARKLMAALKQQDNPPSMKLFDDADEEHKIWEVREAALGATAHVPGKPLTWPGWEDAAVPPGREGDYLRDLRKLFDKYGYDCALYGHFGQGCIHVRIDFDLVTHHGIEQYRSFISEAADLVVSYGGSISGEHGDGQARAALLPKMFGDDLIEAFREFKRIWDPDWKMNPGKVVDAYTPTQNLRLGADYNPWHSETHFQFPDDDGSFARAVLRCVGVGKCRRHEGGTMCPSYMVTREEEHATRGRARLLFEMLQGDVIGTDGWHDEHVRDALDLCLACKGCKGDCPVHVDMATYKAEFLSHYYEGRLRPRHAYAFGLIMYWSRIASRVPRLANVFTQTPLLRSIAKFAAGIAPERKIPPFARQTFKDWFRARGPHNIGHPKVMLWPDTFNNYFKPETAQAAVEVLEAAGYQVIVPEPWLCCGRPLFDYGMLDTATHLLRNMLDALREEIRAGTPVIGLEPSCAATFRDELTNLFPHDEDARRLRQQTYLLSEFLQQHAPDYAFPQLKRKAVVHGHCHHKAIMKLTDEEALLKRLGLDFEVLDSGCCGMAGAFGYEKGDHYDVSIKAGERVLLPAVRQAANDTIIITDGFSCREQIVQTTDRHALHLAEVLQMALREGSRDADAGKPDDSEQQHTAHTNGAGSPNVVQRAVIVGASVLVGGVAVRWLQRHRHD